ncbi:MAG: isoleucine--tRNA ligase [Oscillospiraceae bacterium]|jgi:isoleucyl-tRNA synthetase|nr:isoleucine--tRNA ligase [Oscillospiraceae bacterium]
MEKDYNKTLNLLETQFPMRANLPEREPDMLRRWEEISLYEQILKRNEDKPKYVLHDGPPYANGDIHLGTALNKTLKDFIVRYKNMAGFCSPYVPGWDTHGLPTELKARAKAGVDNNTEVSDLEIRKICREFTLGYLDDQRNQFKRLGGIGEWNNPYITLKPEFEKTQIEVFAEMACNGLIYKGLKPVYWCTDCRTALAEAEIEYAEDPCLSVYVKFKVSDDKGKLSALGADVENTYFVIWTTTTWTLPGNVAICLGPEFTYKLVKAGEETYIIASELVEKAMEAGKIEQYETVAELKGKEFEYMTAQHPFLDRQSLIIIGDHVTLESGTGCVHTAPGHGVDDYNVCRNYPEIPMVVPVDSAGKMTAEAGDFVAGYTTEEANKIIGKRLAEDGAFFAKQKIVHKYPHCWRCKQPVLFRATDQWFCSIDSFKDAAVKAIGEVKWYPAWGEERIASMVRDRKDWCISRQRRWGVPIPIFYCKDCGKEYIDKAAMFHVADLFGQFGSDVWFERAAEALLPEGAKCKECGCTSFDKERDIMDVWFDSGVSHAAVCKTRPYLTWPADMYLEGADQYRGWFQSSLLTSVATTGKAPYKEVCTHGWVVDGKGEEMHKSKGNGIAPSEIVNKFGADILRLWVASSDYHADIRISDDILKQLSESYRKIRNTCRFILANIPDFSPDTDCVSDDMLHEIDKWAVVKTNELIDTCIAGYDKYEFHQVYHAVIKFCVVDMSNFYLDVIKDRLYCDAADSVSRRAAQTVIFNILDVLTRLLAPLLSFTMDEVWQFMPHRSGDAAEAVMFNQMPEKLSDFSSPEFSARWDRIHQIRDNVQRALEVSRKSKIIGKSLEADVVLYCNDEVFSEIVELSTLLPSIFIVSNVIAEKGECDENPCDIKGLGIKVIKAAGEKCERCWSYDDSVGDCEEHPTLCGRCVDVITQK